MCKVSFVTSVYNCEEYIAETVRSVIDQTFDDWEFILIDDCSKDRSAEIIRSFDDNRIKLISNEINAGQSANLNKGISIAKGKYIARLDHDDICYPERIAKQYEYMERNPDIDICGCYHDIWCEGKITSQEYPPIHGESEQMFSLFCGNFNMAHSSFFIRKKSIEDNEIKYSNYRYAEDFDFLFQMLCKGKIGYVEEPLLAYRVFPEQFTQTCGSELIDSEMYEIYTNYNSELRIESSNIIAEAVTHRSIRSKKDYYMFEEAMIKCAKHFGIDEIKENECIRYVYKSIFRRQGNSIASLMAYFHSEILPKGWLVSLDGIKYIVACILCYNK